MPIKDCFKGCKHKNEAYSSYLTPPINTTVRNFNSIVQFFQYNAPQIDCIHSFGQINDQIIQEALFQKLVSETRMNNRYKFIQRFQPNSLELFKLEGTEICIRCPRMICKKGKDETELSSLLRHLRNVFAHGRTYIKRTKNQTYVVLEDYDTGKKPKLTAKIVVTKAILEKWKAIIENQIEV